MFNSGDSISKGKDHTHFLVFIEICLTAATISMIAFLKTDYNRRRANQGINKKNVQENLHEK